MTSPRLSVISLILLSLALPGRGACDDSRQAGSCQALTDAGGVLVGSGLPGDPAAPEPASGYRLGKRVVTADRYLVVTANPLASEAGCRVLARGGRAVDAAVAVQAVLGLVEPQSSGLGGGAFMLHYGASDHSVMAYDGRETAPAAATPNHLRWVDDSADRTPPKPSARGSGRSIGTPGVVRLLGLAHQAHGRLPWQELFAPAIRLATEGFPIGGRMAAAIAAARADLVRDAEASAAYLEADGRPKALGSLFRLPAYAETLTAIADQGADAFYTGPIAQAIVDKINATVTANDGRPITPGKTTLADLAGYQAKRRAAICFPYRHWQVCGMPPPSSGGLTVAQTLGILGHFDLDRYRPTASDGEGGRPGLEGVHLVAEAERLAYADRDRYVADTDFVPLPGGSGAALLDPAYLRRRAGLIRLDRSMGTAPAGDFPAAPPLSAFAGQERGTTHFTIVDREDNVVSMTSSVESGFGSWHMVRGFILNNQLTDFADAPTDDSGLPIANAVAPLKRPRSSMAPTLVFTTRADGRRDEFLMATGSPGGGAIIQYVVKTLVGTLDWGLDAQQSANLIDFGATNSPITNLGGEHPLIRTADNGNTDPLVAGLRALGHSVNLAAQSSGIATVLRVQRDGRPLLTGGADPRREGLALGDWLQP
jgi:gamma-glutamyltranspeptidase/glutathione hydrolase